MLVLGLFLYGRPSSFFLAECLNLLVKATARRHFLPSTASFGGSATLTTPTYITDTKGCFVRLVCIVQDAAFFDKAWFVLAEQLHCCCPGQSLVVHCCGSCQASTTAIATRTKPCRKVHRYSTLRVTYLRTKQPRRQQVMTRLDRVDGGGRGGGIVEVGRDGEIVPRLSSSSRGGTGR